MNSNVRMFEKLLIIACFIFMVLITFFNCMVFFKNRIFPYFIPFIIIISITYIAAGYLKVPPLLFSIILFAAAFILKVFIALYYNIPPASDFLKFYNAAIQAANGNFSYSSEKYFSLWAYQTGIVSYYAVLIKLFGNGLLALKVTNCLFMAGSNIILYLLSKTLVSEKYAKFIALLYLVYPAPYFMASVLTNQHISNFFILLGVYLFISRYKISPLSVTASAICIAIGNAMRPQGVILIAAVTGCLLLKLSACAGDKKQIMRLLLSVVCVICIYMFTMQSLSMGVKLMGLNANGLENKFPLYKFVVGLNHETNGCYSLNDAKSLTYIKDPVIRDKRAINIIRQRISEPPKFIRLILNKQYIMWARLDDSVELGFYFYKDIGLNIFVKKISYPVFKLVTQKAEKCFYIFVLVMAILGLATSYKAQNIPSAFIIALFTILANFGIYSFIEIQNRYRDLQIIFVFLVAAVGIEAFMNFCHTWFSGMRRSIPVESNPNA